MDMPKMKWKFPLYFVFTQPAIRDVFQVLNVMHSISAYLTQYGRIFPAKHDMNGLANGLMKSFSKEVFLSWVGKWILIAHALHSEALLNGPHFKQNAFQLQCIHTECITALHISSGTQFSTALDTNHSKLILTGYDQCEMNNNDCQQEHREDYEDSLAPQQIVTQIFTDISVHH